MCVCGQHRRSMSAKYNKLSSSLAAHPHSSMMLWGFFQVLVSKTVKNEYEFGVGQNEKK